MGIPQILTIGIYVLGLYNTIRKHGQPKEGYEDAETSLIAVAIMLTLLAWGGFFE